MTDESIRLQDLRDWSSQVQAILIEKKDGSRLRFDVSNLRLEVKAKTEWHSPVAGLAVQTIDIEAVLK